MTKQFSISQTLSPNIQFDVVVGMAVYRGDKAEWVEQAVKSILSQTYREFLYVIVLDGYVPDEIRTLLTGLERLDERVLLATSNQNLGLSSCMNFIIDWTARLKPKYFFRMDADDVSLPQRLQVQIEYFNANENISVLGSALEEINEAGHVVGSRMLPLSHQEILVSLPKRCSINHPTVGIRFEVFEKGYRYRNDCGNVEDYYLWTDLARDGFLFKNLPDKLLRFRRANDFFVRRGVNKSYNELRARLFAMDQLNRKSLNNYLYASAVFILRLMPTPVIKLAYKVDRYLLEKWLANQR